MKKQAFHVIRTLSPFFATAAVALTFVSAPISIDTAKAQQSATEQEAYAIVSMSTVIDGDAFGKIEGIERSPIS